MNTWMKYEKVSDRSSENVRQKPNRMKSKVIAFPVFTFGTSVTPRIFRILWISLKGSQNLYKWAVQDRHILAFSQGGWYVDPFQIGGIFHNGSKSHWRAQISRRRLRAEPGFPSRPTCIENINEKLILKTKARAEYVSVYFWSWSCRTVQEIDPSNTSKTNEVTNEVFLGKKSHVWQQASNRVHVQKSILLYCFDKLR